MGGAHASLFKGDVHEELQGTGYVMGDCHGMTGAVAPYMIGPWYGAGRRYAAILRATGGKVYIVAAPEVPVIVVKLLGLKVMA
ncbi:MAG: hypothetical protein BGO09_10390 [Bacteroidetes bacterium 47-18]|nr:MAG: hypothetical protein BGO09_10390 [Bacteroidetes bacterium 47-18]